MSAEIMPFGYDGDEIRTLTIDGEPWFVATDIAKPLGYRDAHNMVRGLDEDEQGYSSVRTPGGDQRVLVLSEAGLYGAVLGSHVEGARDFKRWIKHDVIPAIRQTGSYEIQSSVAAPPSNRDLARMVIEEADRADAAELELSASRAELEEAQPKVNAYDALMSTDGSISMGDAAKVLGIGRNTMYKLLREEGIIERTSTKPYAEHAHRFLVTMTKAGYPVTQVLPSHLDYLARRLGVIIEAGEAA